ncbi:MAG: DUF924 family protein [Cyanobacteria bacterium J06600_6]
MNPNDILDFWFDKETKPLWFKKQEEFDRQIKEQFLDIYQLAKTGAFKVWRNDPASTLALIIVLDQFPRNMFRDNAQAFATDNQAVELTKYAVQHNYHLELTDEQQTFLYMPLMHSEDRQDQAKSIELFQALGRENNLKFAIKHQQIIDRFQRFPHRNKILGRKSTTAEQEFLSQPGSSF